LITVGLESDVLLWNLNLPNPVKNPRLLAPKALGVQSIQASPQGRWLLGRTGDQGYRLWDLQAEKPDVSVTTITESQSPPERVLFDPSDRWLALVRRPLYVELWRLIPTPRRLELDLGSDSDARAAASRSSPASRQDPWSMARWDPQMTALDVWFSDDSRWLAFSAQLDPQSQRYYVPTPRAGERIRYGTLRVWNLPQQVSASESDNRATTSDTKRLPSSISIPIERTVKSPVLASPKFAQSAAEPGRLVTFDGTDTTLWKATSERRLVQELRLTAQAPVTISPSGRWLATHNGEAIRLWDLHDQNIRSDIDEKKYILIALERPRSDVYFTSNERWLVIPSVRGNVRLWDLQPEPQRESHDLKLYDFPAKNVELSRDGQWLAVRSQDSLRMWDLRDSPRPLDGVPQHRAPVTGVEFLADGSVVTADAWTMRVFRPGSGDPAGIIRSDPETLPPLAVSADERWYAVANGESIVQWRIPQDEHDPAVGHDYRLDSQVVVARFSEDSRWLAAGCANGAIYVWDKNDNSQQQPRKLDGHTATITQLSFTHGTQNLVTASRDGSLRIWSLSEIKNEPTILPGHPDGISSFAISPDSSLLVTRGFDQISRLWSLNAHEEWSGTAWSGGGNGKTPSSTSKRPSLPKLAADNELGKTWNEGLGRLASQAMIVPPRLTTTLPAARPQDRSARVVVPKGSTASWFPDGRRLAYGNLTGAESAPQLALPETTADPINLFTGGGIKVLDTTTGEATPISERGKNPAVSPDGQWIVCVVPLPFAGYDSESIWLMTAAGRNARRLVENGTFPSWSADSKAIFYFSRRKNAVCRLPIENPEKETIVFANPTREYCAVSPDEKMIAYGDRDGTFKIVDIKTRKLLHSFWLPQNGYLPAWSPSTAQPSLGFGSYDGINAALYVYDLASNKLYTVREGPFTMPAWSRDSSTLAYDYRPSDDSNAAIWLVGAGETEKSPSFHPNSILPDGDQLRLGSSYRSLRVASVREVPENWQSVEYDDSSWDTGRCALSQTGNTEPDGPIGNVRERMRLFRLRFQAPGKAEGNNPLLTIRAPGMVRAYLNGKLQFERGVINNGPDQWCLHHWIDPASLVEGQNLLAVEIVSYFYGDPFKLFDASIASDGVSVLSGNVLGKAIPRAARESAMRTFSELTTSQEAASVLRKLLKDDNEEIQKAAIRSLALSQVDADSTLALLFGILDDPARRGLHTAVIEALGTLGPRASTAIPKIERLLQTRSARIDPQMASSAWVSLLKIAPSHALKVQVSPLVMTRGANDLHRAAWNKVVRRELDRQQFEWAKLAAEAAMKLDERLNEELSNGPSTGRYEGRNPRERPTDLPHLQTVLGVALYRLQHYKQAATSFESAHDASGGDPADLFAWAMALEGLGDKSQAEQKLIVARHLMRSGRWANVPYARVLRDEAEKIVGTSADDKASQDASAAGDQVP
jgi:WD40 repeat protein